MNSEHFNSPVSIKKLSFLFCCIKILPMGPQSAIPDCCYFHSKPVFHTKICILHLPCYILKFTSIFSVCIPRVLQLEHRLCVSSRFSVTERSLKPLLALAAHLVKHIEAVPKDFGRNGWRFGEIGFLVDAYGTFLVICA